MKDVPYFPLYAANTMASKPFRLMTLEQRGLWITLMMECWVNGGVPSDLGEMAKFLGLSVEEVSRSFTDLQTFSLDKQGSQIISNELEEQRQKYLNSREGKSKGGKLGAERKKEKQRLRGSANPEGIPEGQAIGSLIQVKSNYIKSSSIKLNQLTNKDVSSQIDDDWVRDYVNSPEAGDYAKQSRGS